MTYSTEDLAAPNRIGTAWANLADGGFNRRLPDLDILAILRRNLRFIVVIVALIVIATGWWVSRQPPIFQAGAALVLEASDTPSELDTGQNQGNVTPTTVFTEIEVMRSRDFAANLAERLDLFADPRINPQPIAPTESGMIARTLRTLGLSAGGTVEEMSADARRERAITNLQGLYAVSGNPRHNVIEITSTHRDPVLAARIANGVAGLYMNNTLSKQVANLDRRIKFLAARSDELSGDLSAQQVAMTSLIQDNKLRDDDATRLLLAELTPLQRRLNGLSEGSEARQTVQTRIDEIEKVLNSRVSAEIELAKQELALQTDMKRFDTVNQRLSELEAQRDAAQSNARQISVAEVPRTPIGPNAPASLAVALVAGTLLAAILALFREGLDRRVRSPGQTEAETGLNVIASLPKLPWSALRQHKRPHAIIAANAYPAFSQAIRSLVTAVDARGEGGGRFVFVGSPLAAEGKSSIATSMAVAAAMDDLKVLLIDFDVHRGGATAAFKAPPGKTTVGSVLGDVDLLEKTIQSTPYPGVDFLNFRHGSRFSRKVVNQKGLSKSLDALRERYDMIIFDTPPYLISEESNRLGRLSDTAILVSRWGRTDRSTLTQTAQRMQRNGLNVAGIVVNGVEPRRAEVYGYVDYAAYDYVKRA